MEITVSLKDLFLILIGMGLVVLICYFICLVKNLIVTVKHTNKILKDAEVVTAIAAERATEVDKTISDVSQSVGSIADMIRGNQSTVKALTCLINSISSLKKLLEKEE